MNFLKNIFMISAAILIFTGCIQTPEPDVPFRFAILYNVSSIGDTVVVDQDSISIDEIKLLVDKFNIRTVDDPILQTNIDALVMRYVKEFDGLDETILATNIGFEDYSRFNGLDLFVSPPNDEDNINDNDFFGQNTNYSLVFRGVYNGQNFTYKSSPDFLKEYTFDSTVELTNELETLLIRFTYDFRDIILDPQQGTILDPTVNQNKTTIDSLLQVHLSVEGNASNVIY